MKLIQKKYFKVKKENGFVAWLKSSMQKTIEKKFLNSEYYNRYRRFMLGTKKKTDLANILDDLRSEDLKKRLNAVQDIKEVAAAMGPARVKSELIGFLAQFVDDEQNVVFQLLAQLQSFTALVGGTQNQKCLLPLLIAFCKTDQKKTAFKSCQLIQRILGNCKDQVIDTIKKLIKTDLNVAKQCGIQLIAALLPQLESNEAVLMEIYSPMHTCDNPQLKIIASKYLTNIVRKLKSKDQIPKILEAIYSEGDQLAKIYALPALVQYYDFNNNFALTKFKNLLVINSWRINIKICEIAETASQKISKPHFKLIFEPMLLKFMTSVQPELRCSSCRVISALCKNLTEEEQKSKLLPLLKKIVVDPVQYVKIQLSKNIVGICGHVSVELINESMLPIIFNFIKDPSSQITLGIIKGFQYLASKVSKEVFDDKIIKPLLAQLHTQNWRIKCEIISILKGFLVTQIYLNEAVLKVFIGLTDDKIDAVRLKANQLIIQIIKANPKEWSEQYILPKVFTSKENISYIKKQNLLEIIDKTATVVSEKTLKDVYQGTIVNFLGDKVPNVKLKSMQVVKTNAKLLNPTIEKQVQKLKEDKDTEIKDFAKKIRG